MTRLALAAVAGLLVALPAAAATKQYSSGRLALPIASGRTAEHTIAVRDPGPVSHAAVSVRLTATRLADLTLSPRGTGYPVGKAFVANLRVFLRKSGYLS